MASLTNQLKLPDLWQQQAIRALQAGRDVIVAAPTGAGKTYVFELLVENGFEGRAVYTVPTRALANDKRLEWSRKGWDVGIATGDRSENPNAKILVATLETQKANLVRGEGPDLLVIDEYQMLGDQHRGLNYELSVACAPPHTQLLLLSGSVGNPRDVAEWLRRLGRKVELINHRKRPVPLEEIHIESLPDTIPHSVKGFWPRGIARILKAGMAPLLAFAPRRRAAEELAYEIARMLPEEDPLVLTPEQEKLAGDGLRGLLRARVAFHHSGLDYCQRAGLIEPLAKAGQLRVVVATMGLAAGINFSMRSVLVTDRLYRSGDTMHEVRPDELLQMFGRAGRRGMDKVGYIAVAHGKPRMQEARPLRLRRSNQIDWPSLIGVMQAAIESSQDPAVYARNMVQRLFSIQRIQIGLARFSAEGPSLAVSNPRIISQKIVELQNPDGHWERKKRPVPVELGACMLLKNGTWMPALSLPECLANLKFGSLCKIRDKKPESYARSVPVARFGENDKEGELVLNKWLVRSLRSTCTSNRRRWHRTQWTLEAVEKHVIPQMPQLTQGGVFYQWREKNSMLYAILDYRTAVTYAHKDSSGRALVNPIERTVNVDTDLSMPADAGAHGQSSGRTVADLWYSLGLIDRHAAPTRRGILFSFFNYGEGLAISAALEDPSYPIEDIIPDLANLRAGHRFGEHESSTSRLGTACRAAFGMVTLPGYLVKGLPATYGEGASEVLFQSGVRQKLLKMDPDLRNGDIQRVRLEWGSLIRHIASAPNLNWDRWLQLKSAAAEEIRRFPDTAAIENLPALTPQQRKRHKSFLTFD